MPQYNAQNAECLVFSFKDGLLAKLAHDLKIEVTRFELDVDEAAGTVRGSFDTKSLRVVCARRDGQDDPGTLSDGDKKKIHGNIEKDVLKTKRFPQTRFESSEVSRSGDSISVKGALTLCGKTSVVSTTAKVDGAHWVAEIDLHQPDFGIKPFSAALGALKVKPDVRVVLRIPKT